MPSRFSRGGERQRFPPPGSQASKEDDEDATQIPLSQAAPLPPPTQLERPPDCINRHPTPAFAILCSVMDRLRSEEASKRRDTLTRFMNIWRLKVGNDLYPLIRLLLPDRDRERPVYNLKEAMLAKCYIEVLGLDRHSESAQRLIKWKQPVEGQSDGFSGDFARVCYHEIAARSTVEEGTLSVDGVNAILDELAKGRMKQAEYVPILRRVNEQCTPTEQEWIIRIILKDLRISIREKGVFSCFHPEAATLFNVCSDLKRVCWTLYKPEIRLEKNQANIELFRCFLPQLCHRSPSSSHDAIAKLVGAPAEFIMEEKLDGERIQLHMRGGGAQWFYCSRKAKDYTYLYGSHIGEGSLTQYISGVFQDDVENVILDGEMMVWDPALEKYLAFGTLKTAAGDRVADENSPRPCFKVFDILYLNGRCLSGIRLSERKRLLRSGRVFNNIENFKGRMEFVDERVGKSGKDIREMLEHVLEAKGEGIVVKKAASQYITNSRAADWVKVKPEYADQMGEVGMMRENAYARIWTYWFWEVGGEREGEQEDDGSGETPVFTTFASVGSGMSYEDYEWILNKHKKDWKPFDRQRPPSWMQLGATGIDDKPDVYIDPQKSFVMEVKASEIVPAAGGYGAGYTLRFPRCRFIFWDRASREHEPSDEHRDRDMWNCLSLDEFNALLQNPTKKRYIDDENGSNRRKKRKVAPRRKVQLFESFRGQRRSGDAVESDIFSDLTFYIPKDAPGHKKTELEALVHKHGGDFTQAQLSDGSAIVISSDDKTPRVKAQIRKGISVIKPQWIFESIKRRRPIPVLKELCVYASEQDKGDRYYNKTLEEIDKVSLVRDRTGSGLRGEQGSDHDEADSHEEEEEVEEKEEDSEEEEEEEPESPRETAEASKQSAMAEAWGLDLAPRSSRRKVVQSDEEKDIDDERHDDEEYTDDEETFNQPAKPTQELSPTLQAPSSASASPDREDRLLPVLTEDKDSTMAPGASNYDEERIFTHLVFYIDTPDNAKENGLAASKPPKAAGERLVEAATLLQDNGGVIVDDIDDPSLTHIIMDDEDGGRYVEIFRRTSKPKHKHIVTPSWVTESIEEETLMNEDAHKPS